MKQRSRGGLVPLAVLFLWPSIRPGADLEARLVGRITDGHGVAVAGATVYLRASLDVCPEQTETLRSGSDGSVAASLPPGRYMVAAVKSGYDVAMTEVNTLARPVFELRLKPASGIRLGNLPVGPAGENLGTTWILRQQHGDVLREQRPALPVPVARGSPAAAAAGGPFDGPRPSTSLTGTFLAAVDGEFEQRWGGEDLRGDGSPQSAALGRSTGFGMSGAIGRSIGWRFEGGIGRASAEGEGAYQSERRNDRLSAGMRYDLTPSDVLDASIRFDGARYVVGKADRGRAVTDQNLRAFGIVSRWARGFGGGAGLRIDAVYDEVGVGLADPGFVGMESSLDGANGPSRIVNRTFAGGAGMALEEGSHRIDLGVRTVAYRYDLRQQGVLLAGPAGAPGLAEAGEEGRTVSVTAGDRWQAGPRHEIDYGIAYHAGLTSGEGYLVPRVGMIWSGPEDPGVTVRSEITLLVEGQGASAPSPGDGDGQRPEADRLGYRIGVERRPPEGLRFAASLSYAPYEDGAAAVTATRSFGSRDGRPPLLMDGAAGHHELGVEVEGEFGSIRGGIEGALGRARGRVTPVVEEAPVQILTDGEVRYVRAQAWAQYAPTDTELQIDYQRVHGEAAAASAGPLDFQTVDLVVYQDLPGLRSLGSARLRLLMAYQDLIYGSLYDTVDGAVVSGSASRLTGGVHIFF